MQNFFNWPCSLVGLDITPTEIRLLHLDKAKTPARITNFGIMPLPDGAITDGKIKQPEIVQSTLQQIVQETKTQHLPAAIAFPAMAILSKRIKLPRDFFELEREFEIATNLKNYFPTHAEEFYFDFVRLKIIDKDYHEILVVAAEREQVNTYLALVQQAGLKVKIIDIDLYAEKRAKKKPQLYFDPHLDAARLQKMTPQLLVSYGLALRRIALW